MVVKKAKISDLKFDQNNLNKGSEHGKHYLDKSLEKFGIGRSIVTDKNGNIIAGNHITQAAAEKGFEDILFVPTDGKTLVVTQRMDIDKNTAEGLKMATEMGLADNQTQKLNYVFDAEAAEAVIDEAVCEEWGVKPPVTATGFGEDFTLPDGDKPPFQQMTFTLADAQAEHLKAAIADVRGTEEYLNMATFGNENSNGNALYLIVMQWAEQRK